MVRSGYETSIHMALGLRLVLVLSHDLLKVTSSQRNCTTVLSVRVMVEVKEREGLADQLIFL